MAGRRAGGERLSARRHSLSHRVHALHAIFHSRLAVAHALAETGALLGRQHPGDVEHRLGHAPAHLVVLLQHLQAHLLDRRGVHRRRGERLHRALAQAATGFALCFEVGGGAGGDLLDLAALRVAGVEAVEHAVDHPAHVLGRVAEHHAAAHAIVTTAHAVVFAPAAHGAHVIHRDIKPANILISWDGTVKVTDFGIAELLSALTDVSMVFGTPGYMAPELIAGRGSLPAGDLFSAGVTLYQCLTGFAPFDRPGMKETLEATLRYDPPPPTAANPLTPLLLETTVMRMLAKDPSERLSRPAELVALLRRMNAEQKFTLNPTTHTARRTMTKHADPMYVPTISLSKADV